MATIKIKDRTRLLNKRVANTDNSTLGILYIDKTPIGFVIEDEPREVKVKGKTRIPAGIYQLGLRREETPLTKKYREKYKWFKWHIELLNVPRFTGIYIHIGNEETNTDGCQLVGLDGSTKEGEFINKQSTRLFKPLYLELLKALEAGHVVYYQIIDN